MKTPPTKQHEPSAAAVRAAIAVSDKLDSDYAFGLAAFREQWLPELATIIDTEFAGLVDLRAALKDIADWPRPFTGETASAMADHAKTILAAVERNHP